MKETRPLEQTSKRTALYGNCQLNSALTCTCTLQPTRRPGARTDALGKAALFSVHKLVGARQVRPAPLYWGLDLERVALAGPIPEPHAP